MDMNTGAILTAMVLGVVLTGAASWAVTGLYRRRMLALMRRSPAPDLSRAPDLPAVAVSVPARPAAPLDAAGNRRYLFVVSALSLLIGITQSVLALAGRLEQRRVAQIVATLLGEGRGSGEVVEAAR